MLRQIWILSVVAVLGCQEKKATPAPAQVTGATAKVEAAEYFAELIVGAPPKISFGARGGYHINDEYPVAFTPTGGPKAILKDKLTLTRCENEPHSCRAEAEVAAGTVSGMLAISVCSAEKCLIEKIQLAAGR